MMLKRNVVKIIGVVGALALAGVPGTVMAAEDDPSYPSYSSSAEAPAVEDVTADESTSLYGTEDVQTQSDVQLGIDESVFSRFDRVGSSIMGARTPMLINPWSGGGGTAPSRMFIAPGLPAGGIGAPKPGSRKPSPHSSQKKASPSKKLTSRVPIPVKTGKKNQCLEKRLPKKQYKYTTRKGSKVEIQAAKDRIPNRLKTPDGRLDLSKFTKPNSHNGQRLRCDGPQGWNIRADDDEHRGSVWKLYRGDKNRVASIDPNGKVVGK